MVTQKNWVYDKKFKPLYLVTFKVWQYISFYVNKKLFEINSEKARPILIKCCKVSQFYPWKVWFWLADGFIQHLFHHIPHDQDSPWNPNQLVVFSTFSTFVQVTPRLKYPNPNNQVKILIWTMREDHNCSCYSWVGAHKGKAIHDLPECREWTDERKTYVLT